MLLYVIIFISITLFISLIQFSKLMKPPKVQEKGKILCSWMTPNGMWLTTKMFIVGISLMFLLPKYTIIHTPNQVTNKSQNIIDLINSIEIEMMLPHQASTGDLIFVIIYLIIILVIINIPFKYNLSTNGVFYEVPVIGIISFYVWDEIICYDIERKHGNIFLKIWFRPPCFAPDWTIRLDEKVLKEVEEIFKKRSVHYNEAKNNLKKKSNNDLRI